MLTSHLTLLDQFNISVDVLELSYFVEKVERVGDDGFVSKQFVVREVFLANSLNELLSFLRVSQTSEYEMLDVFGCLYAGVLWAVWCVALSYSVEVFVDQDVSCS